MITSAELVPVPRASADGGAGSPVLAVLDIVVGTSVVVVTGAVGGATAVGRRAAVLAAPVMHLVLRPPLVGAQLQPATYLDRLGRRGGVERNALTDQLGRALDVLVPALLVEILRRVDVAATVERFIPLDALVTGVDIDAIAARLDVDAVAARIDVSAVIDRLDLTAIVRDNVDLDLIVSGVDLDAAATRITIDPIAARVDIDAIIDRIDLVGLAEQVINAIDLPEIIREATGSVASETVRGVRMQGIAGDEAIGRVVDRLLLRRGVRRTKAADVGTDELPIDQPGGPVEHP